MSRREAHIKYDVCDTNSINCKVFLRHLQWYDTGSDTVNNSDMHRTEP